MVKIVIEMVGEQEKGGEPLLRYSTSQQHYKLDYNTLQCALARVLIECDSACNARSTCFVMLGRRVCQPASLCGASEGLPLDSTLPFTVSLPLIHDAANTDSAAQHPRPDKAVSLCLRTPLCALFREPNLILGFCHCFLSQRTVDYAV